MWYRETITVFSEIHIKRINALCGGSRFLLILNLVVCKVTTGL